MFINVIKAEDNINYVECKDYTVFISNDDGTVSPINNFLAMADRLWVEEAVVCSIGENCIYEIKTESGVATEGKIIEKGEDDKGNYIVILNFSALDHISMNEKHPILPTGRMELNLVLSPDMLTGSEELLKHFNGTWPSFHESMPKVVKKSPEYMIIRFSGGFLSYVVVDMKISNVITERCDDGFIESLGGHGLTSVEIRKVGNNIEARLYNDFIISSLPEGFDHSVLEDPDFDFDSIKFEYITEEYKNHWFITCKKIEVTVNIDEDKKRQMDEEYAEFLVEMRDGKWQQ